MIEKPESSSWYARGSWLVEIPKFLRLDGSKWKNPIVDIFVFLKKLEFHHSKSVCPSCHKAHREERKILHPDGLLYIVSVPGSLIRFWGNVPKKPKWDKLILNIKVSSGAKTNATNSISGQNNPGRRKIGSFSETVEKFLNKGDFGWKITNFNFRCKWSQSIELEKLYNGHQNQFLTSARVTRDAGV